MPVSQDDEDDDAILQNEILQRQMVHEEYERQQALIENEAAASEGRIKPPRRRVAYSFNTGMVDDADQHGEDDDVAQILMDAVPHCQSTKTPQKDHHKDTAIDEDLDKDLWAECDRGVAAQRRLT